MFIPSIGSWIKKVYDLMTLGVDAHKIGALSAITTAASPREIIVLVSPAVLFSDYMLKMKDFQWIGRFRQVTVLAALVRAPTNCFSKTHVHQSVLVALKDFFRLELEDRD